MERGCEGGPRRRDRRGDWCTLDARRSPFGFSLSMGQHPMGSLRAGGLIERQDTLNQCREQDVGTAVHR